MQKAAWLNFCLTLLTEFQKACHCKDTSLSANRVLAIAGPPQHARYRDASGYAMPLRKTYRLGVTGDEHPQHMTPITILNSLGLMLHEKKLFISLNWGLTFSAAGPACSWGYLKTLRLALTGLPVMSTRSSTLALALASGELSKTLPWSSTT